VPNRKPWTRRRFLVLIACAAVIGGLVASGVDRRGTPPASGQSFHGQSPRQPSAGKLRVATFNIHGGRNRNGQRDLDLTARTLEDFDFVGLNEVRGGSPWESFDQAERLGRKLGLAWLFTPSEQSWWHGSFGNGALTQFPVRSWRQTPLVNTRGKGYRNVLLAEIAFGDRTVSLLVTHIDRQLDREPQLATVTKLFLSLPEPAVLLGDMNSAADDPQIERLLATAGVVDALSRSEAALAHRIDWIFVRGLEVDDAGVVDLGASDHPCVWAELRAP